ncbi:hypothetical protein BG004_006570 [Podila humilis]|nr:hypothetical protein BG004_006570 [Podila humilis]
MAVTVNLLKDRQKRPMEGVQLVLAPNSHKFSLLVEQDEYKEAKDSEDIWHKTFSDSSNLVARKLQSCVIQSGQDAILCLKVEVYGRTLEEDPHSDAQVALPDVGPFKAVNQMFRGANHLMIGTLTWGCSSDLGRELDEW